MEFHIRSDLPAPIADPAAFVDGRQERISDIIDRHEAGFWVSEEKGGAHVACVGPRDYGRVD